MYCFHMLFVNIFKGNEYVVTLSNSIIWWFGIYAIVVLLSLVVGSTAEKLANKMFTK